MFASLIVISIFTAGITTALTVSSLESSISGPEDLPRARVGTVNTTTSSAYLDDNGVPYINFDTAADAVLALGDGDIDAVVYDAPILKWLVQNNPKAELRVLPATFERQDYGIAMRTDSGFRERVSRAVLQRIGDSAWDKMLQRYLGK